MTTEAARLAAAILIAILTATTCGSAYGGYEAGRSESVGGCACRVVGTGHEVIKFAAATDAATSVDGVRRALGERCGAEQNGCLIICAGDGVGHDVARIGRDNREESALGELNTVDYRRLGACAGSRTACRAADAEDGTASNGERVLIAVEARLRNHRSDGYDRAARQRESWSPAESKLRQDRSLATSRQYLRQQEAD